MEKQKLDEINRLIIAVGRGETGSFERLHELLTPTLRNIALKYIRDDHYADDAVQDFWRNISAISKGFVFAGNGFSYLCKVMTYQSINYGKRINRENSRIAPADYTALEGSGEDSLENLQVRLIIEQAMGRLNDNEQRILKKLYFEDKTLRQIASDLNISKSTAGNLKKSALAKMKDVLDDTETDDAES